MTNELSLQTFIDTTKLFHKDQFANRDPFELLGSKLTKFVESLLDSLGVGNGPSIHGTVAASAVIEGRVYIAEGAVVEPAAYIKGPAYIGPKAEVRHAAYIRGSVYVGP